MIVILQLVRQSLGMLSVFLSPPLTVHVPTLAPTSPPSHTHARTHKYLLNPLTPQFLPVYVLRGCMPTHQAAQRGANQTGQPTVRILIKLSVTAEQRAHRGQEKKKEGKGGCTVRVSQTRRISVCPVTFRHPRTIATPVHKAFIPECHSLLPFEVLKRSRRILSLATASLCACVPARIGRKVAFSSLRLTLIFESRVDENHCFNSSFASVCVCVFLFG